MLYYALSEAQSSFFINLTNGNKTHSQHTEGSPTLNVNVCLHANLSENLKIHAYRCVSYMILNRVDLSVMFN